MKEGKEKSKWDEFCPSNQNKVPLMLQLNVWASLFE